MTLGEKIAALRRAKGMTQQELAEKLHTTKQTIGKYEKGIVSNLPLNRIRELADALDCDPSYLTGWDSPETGGEEEELLEYLEELRTRPEMRMLFDSSRHMSMDQVKAVVAMIERFRDS